MTLVEHSYSTSYYSISGEICIGYRMRLKLQWNLSPEARSTKGDKFHCN